jgi:hypothetical protein
VLSVKRVAAGAAAAEEEAAVVVVVVVVVEVIEVEVQFPLKIRCSVTFAFNGEVFRAAAAARPCTWPADSTTGRPTRRAPYVPNFKREFTFAIRSQAAAYGGSYNQQIASGHDSMHQLMNSYRPPLISAEFFGDVKSKTLGIYVIVPEGYQYCPCSPPLARA